MVLKRGCFKRLLSCGRRLKSGVGRSRSGGGMGGIGRRRRRGRSGGVEEERENGRKL